MDQIRNLDLPIVSANVRALAPDGTPPPDAPDWIWGVDHPYLHGWFAPTAREYAAEQGVTEEEALSAGWKRSRRSPRKRARSFVSNETSVSLCLEKLAARIPASASPLPATDNEAFGRLKKRDFSPFGSR